jgi:hypothetical protein
VSANLPLLAYALIARLHERRVLMVARNQFRTFEAGHKAGDTLVIAPQREDAQDVLQVLSEAHAAGIGEAMLVLISHIDAIDSDSVKGPRKQHLAELNAILEEMRALKSTDFALAGGM